MEFILDGNVEEHATAVVVKLQVPHPAPEWFFTSGFVVDLDSLIFARWKLLIRMLFLSSILFNIH
jgi:hypothetical protein